MRVRAALLTLLVTVVPAGSAPVPKAKPVLPLAEKLDRPPTAPPELAAELAKWDEAYRQAGEEKFAELEKRADELAEQYPDAHDQARVWFAVARVAANAGIDKLAARVEKYARKCLKVSRDPHARPQAYSLLASCEEAGTGEFADRRRNAAVWLLRGYAELLYQELPDSRPIVPEVSKFCLSGDDAPRLRAVMAAQTAARDEALFVAFQVSARTQLVRRLRTLYAPDTDDLRSLAEAELPTATDADKLLERVRAKK